MTGVHQLDNASWFVLSEITEKEYIDEIFEAINTYKFRCCPDALLCELHWAKNRIPEHCDQDLAAVKAVFDRVLDTNCS
jgi:hypothetical protein